MKKFTFSKYIQFTYPKDYIPENHLDIKGECIDRMVKKGYLVSDVVVKETVTFYAKVAKANIPIQERRKLQKEINMLN